MVQWVGLRAFTAEGLGWVPGRETKIPRGVTKKLKKKKKVPTRSSLLGVESEPVDPRNMSSDSYLCHADQEYKQKRRISLQKSAERLMKIPNLFTYSWRWLSENFNPPLYPHQIHTLEVTVTTVFQHHPMDTCPGTSLMWPPSVSPWAVPQWAWRTTAERTERDLIYVVSFCCCKILLKYTVVFIRPDLVVTVVGKGVIFLDGLTCI